MFEIKVTSTFSAAHHLLNYEGACENQHGHNFKVTVIVRGTDLNESGIILDFKLLKKELGKVLSLLDHKDLNELEYFRGKSPSSENISKFIYLELKKTTANIYSVSIGETDTSCATYFEEL